MSKEIKNIKNYNVTGFYNKNGEKVTFSRTVRAVSEDDAKEIVQWHFGSKHRIRRILMNFVKVTELKKEQINDPIVEVLNSSADFKLIRG